MKRNLELDQARALLAAQPVNPTVESVALDQALGRVLACDVFATLNAPPFDRSPFDGYAFRGEDTVSASRQHPVALRVLEEVAAGHMPGSAVSRGDAVKILTGAPIPPGANATIKYEETAFTETQVQIFSPVRPGTNIVYAGEDIRKSSLLAKQGTRIDAPMLGGLATQGIARVDVYRQPVVQILNTGSELVSVGKPLTGAQIYNSNVFTIGAYLRQFGCIAQDAGIVEDAPEKIAARADAALKTADLLITTGGASVGDYDYAVRAAEQMGAEVLFWKTNMKPGGALMAAGKDGKLILSLSGSPGAAVLGLLMVAAPYIRKLCGRRDLATRCIQVALAQPLNKTSDKLRLVRGKLELQDGRALFSFASVQGNGAVASMSGCDLIGKVEAGRGPLAAGEMIEAEFIEE